jgi:hypothetical protein
LAFIFNCLEYYSHFFILIKSLLLVCTLYTHMFVIIIYAFLYLLVRVFIILIILMLKLNLWKISFLLTNVNFVIDFLLLHILYNFLLEIF